MTTPTVSLEQLENRSNLDNLYKDILTCTDRDRDVSMYCMNDTPDHTSPFVHARGLVYEKDELKARSFPYSEEYVPDDTETKILPRLEPYPPSEITIHDSYEGFIIRVFFVQNKWYISTHRKLDAFQSYWCCKKSHGTLFQEALESEFNHSETFQNYLEPYTNASLMDRFLQSLNKEYTYTFMVCNNEENRIVCVEPERPMVLFLGYFTSESWVSKRDVDVGIPVPKQLKVENINDVIDYVNRVDITVQQGVVVLLPNGSVFKIFHPEYDEYYRIRGNEKSIKFRYLQVRMDARQRAGLYDLYPNMMETMDQYENTLYRIARHLKNQYIKRYIHKEFETIPKPEFKLIQKCHEWHKEDRGNNHVFLEKVIEILNEQTPSTLNHLIKDYLKEQSLKESIPSQ